MALLQVENLYVDFRTIDGVAKVIDDVSFEVEHGESLGIVGESGCGKTTVMKAILGILPESAIVRGSIKFKGMELLKLSREELYRIKGKEFGYIPQEPMTALSPLHYWRSLHRPLRGGWALQDRVVKVQRAEEEAGSRGFEEGLGVLEDGEDP